MMIFGNFKTQKDAVDIATQMARNIKTTVVIHSSKKDVDNEVLITNEDNVLDYTSFLTVEEVLDKTESDLKLAKAEMTVALVESKRIKAQLKGADPVETNHLILSIDELINFCPPKPGSTLITKTLANCGKYCSITFTSVFGETARDAPILFVLQICKNFSTSWFVIASICIVINSGFKATYSLKKLSNGLVLDLIIK
ncbi:hypothetical protein FQA39_LY12941 [Lamprigera yunnana]|nr:hypothetical protein FQA39_LY12941 [Lamprigera yunnana]